MRILLTGASGQLGTDLRKALTGQEVVAPTHQELDICDSDRVSECVLGVKPDLVVNAAASHKTDQCETAAERAFQVNVYGVRNISLACKSVGAVFLHMSTDYVFDGEKHEPYLEDDIPLPVNLYGISKLAGELIIRSMLDRYFVVRTSALFGSRGATGKGGNFVLTMLRLARDGRDIQVVDDQRFSPTYTVDLARKIAWLVQTECYGTCHITNSGHCSWYEFACKVFDLAHLRPGIKPVSTARFGAPARRPPYSVLGHGVLEKLDSDDLREWPRALATYLDEVGVA